MHSICLLVLLYFLILKRYFANNNRVKNLVLNKNISASNKLTQPCSLLLCWRGGKMKLNTLASYVLEAYFTLFGSHLLGNPQLETNPREDKGNNLSEHLRKPE